MMKRAWNGRKQSCKTWCLACNFFSICKILPHKKRKKKKKENYCYSQKFFPLQMKCFFIFAKVFYAKFVPKITIRESFYQKFRGFLISRKFLFANVSAPNIWGNFFSFFFLLLLIYLKLTIKKFASSKFIAIVIKLINVN